MPKHRKVNYKRDALWRMRWESHLQEQTRKKYANSAFSLGYHIVFTWPSGRKTSTPVPDEVISALARQAGAPF